MQKLIKTVNSDKEVGWVLPYVPFNRRDGKEVNREETFKLLYQSIDKPNMTFWQNDIEKGAMMGITIDSTGLVLQAIEMAYKILDGEKPQNIKPVYPEKSYFLLNFVTVQRLKLVVPTEIVDGAWRIYTDYDGNFIGHK